jgi:hypothetical protein
MIKNYHKSPIISFIIIVLLIIIIVGIIIFPNICDYFSDSYPIESILWLFVYMSYSDILFSILIISIILLLIFIIYYIRIYINRK